MRLKMITKICLTNLMTKTYLKIDSQDQRLPLRISKQQKDQMKLTYPVKLKLTRLKTISAMTTWISIKT